MVNTGDQSIVWVSDSFAEHFGVPTKDLVGRSILTLLEASPNTSWQQLFAGIESVDERFDSVRLHRVGEATSIDEFELRGVRYIDGGRNVMISLRILSSGVGSGGGGMLAEVGHRHAALLRGSSDGVVVHDGTNILFVNEEAARLVGVEQADAVGMRIASLIQRRGDPGEKPGEPADERPRARRVRLWLRQPAGQLIAVDASMALVSWRGDRAVQIVLHDLTLEHHSQRSDAVLVQVEKAVSDAVVSTDEDLRIVDWNPSASEMYGWTLDEVVGRSISDVLGPPDPSLAIGDSADAVAGSDAWRGTVRHHHRDGHTLLVESAEMILRDSDGAVGGLLEVNRPVAVTADDASNLRPSQTAGGQLQPLQPNDARPHGWPDDAAFVADVRAALASGAISVAYQPIVELGTRRVRTVEALARWNHSQRGAINPGQFIPLAERSGVIEELGEWILKQACTDVLLMGAEGIDVELSVNLSVVQLRDPALSQHVVQLLTDTGFPPTRLWIEVTESVLLDDDAILPLQTLHDMGVRLVIDDFGTGYAMFQYITRLPIDSLKIDTTFIAGLGIDARDTAIVRSVVNLGRELGLEVVAEGVETESQRAQLLSLNCRFGQGWLFCRALPFAELVAQYRHSSAEAQPNLSARPAAEEATRLAALHASKILDTDPEPAFDSLAQLSSQLLSTPMALIALVDADRQWFKARVGIEAAETPRGMSFSEHALVEPLVPLIVPDAASDSRFADNPLVTGSPNIRSYAGAPIRSREGMALGALCVLDIQPREFTAEQIGQLQLLAEQAAALIDLRRRAVELNALNQRSRPSDGVGTEGDLAQPVNVDTVEVGRVLADLARISEHRDGAPRDLVNVIRRGSMEIDLDRRIVTVDSREVKTTAKEFELLAFLAARPGHVFSRAELLNHIWSSTQDWQHPATVTEHIYRLRNKIEQDRSTPHLLCTVRGKGYCFGAPDASNFSGEESAAPAPRSGTLVHVGGRILTVDDGMLALLAAKDRDDVVGRGLLDFIAPSSKPAAQARLEMRASGHEPASQVITLLAVDGSELSALTSSEIGESDGEPAVVATFGEILDPPQLIRQLVTGVVNEMSDAVIVTDPELHVLSWNAAAQRLYGWSEREVLGHMMENVVPAHGEQLDVSTAWQELQSTGRWNHEAQQVARDGSIVTVIASVNLIRDEHGLVAGIVAVNRPIPARDESMRLAELESSSALNAPADEALDALVQLAAQLLSAPMASISLLAADRWWCKASVGVDFAQAPGDVTFAAQAIAEPDEVFIVADTAIDMRFADNAFVIGAPYIRSYAGISIHGREGPELGALSVLDTGPRRFTAEQVGLLKALALQAGALIDLRRRAGEVDDLVDPSRSSSGF